MGEGIEERDKKILMTKKDVKDVQSIFETQNKQLSEILKKYR